MLRQYFEARREHPDAILFFRMGDFYEVFFEDAVLLHQELQLTLTAREKNTEAQVPMAGVPHQAADGYIRRLVQLGHRVAICDQLEHPSEARGIVRRGVTRVISPGVTLDLDALEAARPNYLVAMAHSGTLRGTDCWGVAAMDVSTGEWVISEALSLAELVQTLHALEPAELLVAEAWRDLVTPLLQGLQATIRYRPGTPPELGAVFSQMATPTLHLDAGHYEVSHLQASTLRARWKAWLQQETLRDPAAVEAAHALLFETLLQTQGGVPAQTGQPVMRRSADHLMLDPASAANLELFETLMGGRRRGSLFALLDQCRTAGGSRRLRTWLTYPLRNLALIEARHEAVGTLVQDPVLRDTLRDALAPIQDMPRLCSRLASGVGTPRDLRALASSLTAVESVRTTLQTPHTALLETLSQRIDPCPELTELLARALVDDPPLTTGEGGLIRPGFDAELDALTALRRDAKTALLTFERQERERTGIQSLKVGHNRVFGYYIEVTRANQDRVPDDYRRKQTIAGGERYVSEALEDLQQRIDTAQERQYALEARLYGEVRGEALREVARVRMTAEALGELDALCALAHLAHLHGWCRPVMQAEAGIELFESRHPVVELMLDQGRFVPNDVVLTPDRRLQIITGPNMGGKSTVIRQVALCVLLAQMGSFVPAARACIGVVDQIFSRVGASDNLARGQSTFMVEMAETAHILGHASPRSLVVLDEIGRGTSTYDGLSLAWAVAEYLHDQVQCLTLFATHYHELTGLQGLCPHVCNLHVAVREWQEDIIFLHQLMEGPANQSYGIQVARLAGIHPEVVRRAREVLGQLTDPADGRSRSVRGLGGGRVAESPQLALFGAPTADQEAFRRDAAALVEALLAVDPDDHSPREAHAALYALRPRVEAVRAHLPRDAR